MTLKFEGLATWHLPKWQVGSFFRMGSEVVAPCWFLLRGVRCAIVTLGFVLPELPGWHNQAGLGAFRHI
jgi:hypothetical protein